MLSYRFYLRNDVIQVAINHGRNAKHRVSLRTKIAPSIWNEKKERCDGQSGPASIANKKIAYIENLILNSETAEEAKDKVQDYIAPKKKGDSMMFGDIVEDFYNGIRSGAIKSSKGKVMTKGTIANYKSLMDLYNDFGEDIDITKVDMYSLDRRSRQKAIKEARQHFNNFMDHLVLLELSPGYQKEIRAKVKSVVNWIKREMGIDIPCDMRKVYVVVDHIEIPLKYYPVLMSHTIAPSNDLELALDTMMKVQLSTALRFIDVYELQHENIEWSDTPIVRSSNKKTNKRTTAPLAKPASVLIQRNLQETGDIYRGMRNKYKKQSFVSYLNNWIKRIAEINIPERCEISKQNSDGSVYKDYVLISKEITSHDLRRLAANFYLNSGASEMAVQNMTGHVNDSRSFKKHYVQSYNLEKVEEIVAIQSTLNSEQS